jgi:hypothetical protein
LISQAYLTYHRRQGQLSPDYVCCVETTAKAEPPCQRIPGGNIDKAVGQLLVQSVTPLALEVALNVQSEIQSRLAEAERLRQQQVQRAQYEAERAQVRYMGTLPCRCVSREERRTNCRCPLPKSVTLTRKTNLAFIAEMDRLLNEHSEAEVAQIFNERGGRSSTGQPLSLTSCSGGETVMPNPLARLDPHRPLSLNVNREYVRPTAKRDYRESLALRASSAGLRVRCHPGPAPAPS